MEIPAPAGTSSIRFPRRNSDPERQVSSLLQLAFDHREHRGTRRFPPEISGFWRKLKLERTYELDEKRLYLCHGEFPPNARSRKRRLVGVNLSGWLRVEFTHRTPAEKVMLSIVAHGT